MVLLFQYGCRQWLQYIAESLVFLKLINQFFYFHLAVFGNFISCGPRKFATACETLLTVDEIDACETPKTCVVFQFIKTSFRHTEIISPFRFWNFICQKFILPNTRLIFLYPSCSFAHGRFLHHYVPNKLPILLYLLMPFVDNKAHQHKVWLCNSQRC